MKSKTKTEQILNVMRVLTWIAFIGFCIKAGAMLFSYVLSYNSPEGARNLYNGLDLYELRQFNFWYYTQVVSILIAFAAMKAYVFYLVIQIFSKISLMDPFKMEVAQKMEQISYVLLGVSVIGMFSRGHAGWLLDITGKDYTLAFTGEFFFMAGLVFVISQIFKRGVELQSESDLTV